MFEEAFRYGDSPRGRIFLFYKEPVRLIKGVWYLRPQLSLVDDIKERRGLLVVQGKADTKQTLSRQRVLEYIFLKTTYFCLVQSCNDKRLCVIIFISYLMLLLIY